MAGDIGKELPRARTVGGSGKGISRRSLLRLGAKAAVVATIGQWAGRQAYSDEQEAARKGDKVLDALGGFLKGKDQNQSGVQVEVSQKPDLVSAEFKAVFADLTSDEKRGALERVREAKALMLGILKNQVIENVSFNEDLIIKSAREKGVPESLLLGMVIMESSGNEKAVSGVGAKGLTQMMDGMAVKHELNINDGDDDERFIPEKILPATATELVEQYGRYGDWSLAVWDWHAGNKNVYTALQVYLKEAYREELPDINVYPSDESEEAKAVATVEADRRIRLFREAIGQHKITVYQLFENPTITEMFSGEEWNMTDEYVFRVVAASEAYLEEKRKLGLNVPE